jgi:diketogulonate reductase-like aldo/keto reductase
LVGAAVQEAITTGMVTREQLFLQTKFTSVNGQDPTNIPYDPKASLSDQVRQSFEVSLRHFGTEYMDSLVLHSPMRTIEVRFS